MVNHSNSKIHFFWYGSPFKDLRSPWSSSLGMSGHSKALILFKCRHQPTFKGPAPFFHWAIGIIYRLKAHILLQQTWPPLQYPDSRQLSWLQIVPRGMWPTIKCPKTYFNRHCSSLLDIRSILPLESRKKKKKEEKKRKKWLSTERH